MRITGPLWSENEVFLCARDGLDIISEIYAETLMTEEYLLARFLFHSEFPSRAQNDSHNRLSAIHDNELHVCCSDV